MTDPIERLKRAREKTNNRPAGSDGNNPGKSARASVRPSLA